MQARVVGSAVLVVGAIAGLTGCATTTPSPKQFRTFFLPPAPPVPAPAPPEPLAPPPEFADLYANELPSTSTSLPTFTHPNDPGLLIRLADDRFAAGKRALQEGRDADAHREFNRAIQTLLASPDNSADRARLERRLEELTDAIYQYDLDQMTSASAQDAPGFEKRPLDEILEMTFPIDPSLRGKVKQQIRGTGSQLPLEESDAVISLINFFTSTRGRMVLESGMRRSGKYKAMIERVLAEEGLPQELIFLAQAESGFYARAVSYAQAAGMWQFVKDRGREYGLRQTAMTDDRLDPEKATHAAARHLKDLYNHFGDWYLAMAAYNCGPNCVDSAVARTGYADFWALRRLGVLPTQTANYVPAILAMTIVAKNASDYNLNVVYDEPVEYDTVDLKSPTNVALAAAAVDVPVSQIRDLNPSLLQGIAPSGYALHVPRGTLSRLEAAFEVIPESQRGSWRLHKVVPGDTLASLTRHYGSSLAALTEANRGELPEPGLWAAIPPGYAARQASKPVAKPAVKPAATRPAVKSYAKPAARKPVPQAATKTSGKPLSRRSGA